jgi:hypothetical protein
MRTDGAYAAPARRENRRAASGGSAAHAVAHQNSKMTDEQGGRRDERGDDQFHDENPFDIPTRLRSVRTTYCRGVNQCTFRGNFASP